VKARVFQPLENIDEFVLEIDPARPEEVDKALAFYGERLRLALPVILRDEDVPAYRTLIFQRRFGVLQDQNERDARSTFMKWEAGNVGALNLLKDVEDLSADGSLYTLNEQAAAEWNAQGVGQWVLSSEDDAENMKALIGRLGSAAVVPVYQHTPLMISATRPEAGRGVLEDRSRRRFCVEPVGREFVLFSETPFSLLKHLDELTAAGARSFRIDMCYGDVSPDLVQQILAGTSVPGDAANFSRGLL
jgi:hypothetical protein